MLDHFLDVAVRSDAAHREQVKLAQDLQRLPNDVLYGLATGSLKLAFGSSDEWLEKYQGTPMFEEALQLEHAELENEVARQQASVANQSEQFYKTQEQIRLQKKMLDLKLIEASEQQGRQMAPGGQLPESITPTAQGAGALGDAIVEGVQDGAPGNAVGAKMAAAAWDAGKANGIVGRGVQLLGGSRKRKLRALRDTLGEQRSIFDKLGPEARAIVDNMARNETGHSLGELHRGFTAEHSRERAKSWATRAGVGGAVVGGAVLADKATREKEAAASNVEALHALRRYVDSAATNAPHGATDADLADLALNEARKRHGRMGASAEFARNHPVLAHTPGTVAGALMGGTLGAALSSRSSSPALAIGGGALLGGALGALGTPGAARKQRWADEFGGHLENADPAQVAAAVGSVRSANEAKAMREHALALAHAGSMKQNISMTNNAVGLGGAGGVGGAAPVDDSWKTAAANFEKAALGLDTLRSAGTTALNAVKAHPGAAIGAGVGLAGGLAHGMQRDEHGQRHLLRGAAEGIGGAALGAGAGHVGGKFVTNYRAGMGMGGPGASRLEAMRGAASLTGSQLKDEAGRAYGAARGMFRKPLPNTSAAAAPAYVPPNVSPQEFSEMGKFNSAVLRLFP